MRLLYDNNMTNITMKQYTHRLETTTKVYKYNNMHIYYWSLYYRLCMIRNARDEVPGKHQNWMKAYTFGVTLKNIKTNYILIISIEYTEPTDPIMLLLLCTF